MINKYIKTKAESNIITFLIRNPTNDYNLTEIAEGSHIHRHTARNSIKRLLSTCLIERSRKYRKSFMYKINSSNGLIIELQRFFSSKEHLNIIKDID